MAELPSRARVVIIGGGVIGTSVAYHLTRLGWTDVLLLEQGSLSCGTTWHAAGLVGPLRASESGTRLVQYSAELYARLEEETGQATGYKQVGGVIVARTEDRMVQLRRTAANAAAYDMECALLTPDEALEKWPVMAVDDLLGALWLPGDGKVNPTDLTMALARGARAGGARIVERARVLETLVADGPAGPRVTGVRTESGVVEAEVVVNCGGQWAKALAEPLGVTVPLHSAEHFYVVTDGIDGVHPDLPLLRDPDGWTYFKEEVGGLVVGGFEPEAKPWRSPDDLPHPFEFQLLDEDWEHFSVLMDEAVRRVPVLAETGIRKFYNGPESFTPDNQFVMGAAPGAGRLLRRRRLQLRRDRLGRRRGPGPGGVGRRGRGDLRPGRRRHPALRALPRQQPVAAVAGGGGARAALRGAVAEPRDGDRPAVPVLPAARPARGAGCVVRLEDGLGAPQLLRAGRLPDRPVVLLGQAAVAGLVGGGAARHPGGGGGLRPDVVLEVRRRRAGRARGAAVGVRQRRRRAAGAGGLHAAARRARALPVRPDRHPGRRVRVPAGQQLGDHGPRPGLDPAAPPGRLRRPGPRRHHVVRRARGDGAAVPGAAGAADRRRPLGGRVPASRPAGRSRSATRSCGPPG